MGSHAASLIHNSDCRIEFYINQIENNTHESSITLSVTHLITVQTFTKFHLFFFYQFKKEMDDSEDIFSASSHVISLFFQFFLISSARTIVKFPIVRGLHSGLSHLCRELRTHTTIENQAVAEGQQNGR